MILKTFAKAPKFTQLQSFAVVVQTGDKPAIASALQALQTNPDFQGKGWQASFAKLATLFATSTAQYFSSTSDVAFWMNELSKVPNCRAYGYSKSFAALLAYDANAQWPSNYQLNISGGHNATQSTVDAVKALPITRGEFIAVSIGRKVHGHEHGTPAVNAAIRKAMGDVKVFPCPGACGSCTGAGHACGMPQLKGRVIAIAMH